MTKVKKSVNTLLAREEWDFESVPDQELFPCAFYEYARNSPFWLDNVEKRRKHPEWGEVAKELKDWAKPENRESFGRFIFRAIRGPLNFLRLFPEYPLTPWLNIDSAKRSHRLEEFTAGLGVDCPAFSPAKVEALKDGDCYKDSVDFMVQCNLSKSLHYTVMPFLICWDFTDAVLVQQFQRFLKLGRKQPEPQKHKGRRACQPDVLRTRLRDIGAWRLLKSMTVNSAIDYTRKACTDINGIPQPLYGTARSWLRAKKNAEALLKEFGVDGFPVEDTGGPGDGISFLLGTSMRKFLKEGEGNQENNLAGSGIETVPQ